MAAKKTQKKKIYKVKNQKKHMTYNSEISGILLLAFGILVLLSFYLEGSIGVFGTFIKGMFLGLLGLPAFILPPIIIAYAFFVLFKKDIRVFRIRAFYAIILLILISSLIHTGNYDVRDYENMSYLKCIQKYYLDANDFIGGGVLGGLFSTPLLLIFQTLGTIIILTTLCVVDIILLTNISIANFIKNMREGFISRREELAASFDMENNESEKDEVVNKNNSLAEANNSKLQFLKRPKIIDFKIEKQSREIKEKAISDIEGAKIKEEPKISTENDEIQFIMKDLKKDNKADTKSKKDNTDMEIVIPDSREQLQGSKYIFPPLKLLEENTTSDKNIKSYKNSALESAKKLEDTLNSFGVEAKVINISRGPAVTRFELQPSPGVKVSKIVNLADDISLNLAASGVRIEAPIPGKAAIGIEVPNKEVVAVFLKDVVETNEFEKHPSKLAFAIGKDISGESVVADIAKMPHLLIAGATGSGKSVCINSLIVSILYKASPDEVKLLMVDPKVVELGIYNGIPHLLIPVVTDPKKAAGALNWAVQEMVNRYKLFADKGARDIKGYNSILKSKGEEGILPQVVIIIDELADLMMVAPNDVEDAICRLAQMARAAGMHLVIATQRPSVDVITGVIKANIPSRISFAVSSQIDSRTILDMAGAEKLLGKGDMLFYPVGEPKPIRVKGAFVSDKEVESVVEFIKSQGKSEYDENILEEINNENTPQDTNSGDKDELLSQAIELVVEMGQASVSLIQRKFKVGYARAARIVDQMEERGIVGAFEGSKPRQVLISRQQLQELQMAQEQ